MMSTASKSYQLAFNQQHWRQSGQKLLRLAISELAYEGIINLKPIDDESEIGQYSLVLNDFVLTVTARKKRFGGWIIYNVKNELGESSYELSKLFIELCETLEMDNITKAYLIKEINHTWMSEAHLYTEDRISSRDLAQLSGSIVDSELRGHPWLIMGKGRFGFGYHDYQKFVPEMKPITKLPWFAINKTLATFSSINSLTSDDIYANVIGIKQLQKFKNTLSNQGLNPEEYLFLPIHDWQFQHWISLNYGEQLVNSDLIFVGMSEDDYLPLQSIRTYANLTREKSYHIKLPLSILNTAVYRGLPTDRNLVAPQITKWLLDVYNQDQELQETGVVLLGEVATVTAKQPSFDNLSNPPYQFTELLGCLWRDSVENYVNNNEKVISQAALIHHDKNGDYLLPHLISQSNLSVKKWLQQFFETCVPPLLYWLYRYGIVFSPHGENSLLIHENGVPKRMVLKDFVDDINIVDTDFPELRSRPKESDILLQHSPKDLSHFIFTGLFVVHYRYIFDVLHLTYGLTEEEFWNELTKVIDDFHLRNLELQDRINLFQIKRPTFEHVCLNRVRFFTRGYQDNAERPEPVILDQIINPISDNFFKE